MGYKRTLDMVADAAEKLESVADRVGEQVDRFDLDTAPMIKGLAGTLEDVLRTAQRSVITVREEIVDTARSRRRNDLIITGALVAFLAAYAWAELRHP